MVYFRIHSPLPRGTWGTYHRDSLGDGSVEESLAADCGQYFYLKHDCWRVEKVQEKPERVCGNCERIHLKREREGRDA